MPLFMVILVKREYSLNKGNGLQKQEELDRLCEILWYNIGVRRAKSLTMEGFS